jgi:hypothetical protein
MTVHGTTQTLDLDSMPLIGGFLVKSSRKVVLLVDPYLRERCEPRDFSPQTNRI